MEKNYDKQKVVDIIGESILKNFKEREEIYESDIDRFPNAGTEAIATCVSMTDLSKDMLTVLMLLNSQTNHKLGEAFNEKLMALSHLAHSLCDGIAGILEEQEIIAVDDSIIADWLDVRCDTILEREESDAKDFVLFYQEESKPAGAVS